ncbi:hypothetical protein HON22_03245, partial [Candidatus Peregrinibacteria bacterium]|nr:hypothetical protein [Candidatus Peregrinibacteria bacterium]
ENAHFFSQSKEFIEGMMRLRNLQAKRAREPENQENLRLLNEEYSSIEKVVGEKKAAELRREYTNVGGRVPKEVNDPQEMKSILEEELQGHSEVFTSNLENYLEKNIQQAAEKVSNLETLHGDTIETQRLVEKFSAIAGDGGRKNEILDQLKKLSTPEELRKNIVPESSKFVAEVMNKRKKIKVREEVQKAFEAKYDSEEHEKFAENNISYFQERYGKEAGVQKIEEMKEEWKGLESQFMKTELASMPFNSAHEEEVFRYKTWFNTAHQDYISQKRKLEVELKKLMSELHDIDKEAGSLLELFEGEPNPENIAEAALNNIYKHKLDDLPLFQGLNKPSDEIEELKNKYLHASSESEKIKIHKEISNAKLFYGTLAEVQSEGLLNNPDAPLLVEEFQTSPDETTQVNALSKLQHLLVIGAVLGSFAHLNEEGIDQLKKEVAKLFDSKSEFGKLLPKSFALRKDEIIKDVKHFADKVAKDIKESGIGKEDMDAILNDAEESSKKEITEEQLRKNFGSAIDKAETLQNHPKVDAGMQEGLQNIVQDLNEDRSSFEDRIKKLEGNEGGIKKEVQTRSEKLSRTMAILDRLDDKLLQSSDDGKIEWKFVSIMGVIQGLKDFSEYIEGRIDQNKKYEGKLVGKAAANAVPHKYAKEFAMQQESELKGLEEEERNKWSGMEKYDNRDLIENNLLKPQTRHHWRKAMEIAAERGLVRWEDPRLQNVIYELAKKEKPSAVTEWTSHQREDEMTRDNKLRNLCNILTKDEQWFDSTKGKNLSGTKSGRENFDSQYQQINKLAGWQGKLAGMLEAQAEYAAASGNTLNENGQLDKGANGKGGKSQVYLQNDINPHYYANIILKSIEEGMMQNVEQKIFFLIRGVATGLLSEDIFQEVDKWQNQFPPMAVIAGWSFKDAVEADAKMTGSNKGKGHTFSDLQAAGSDGLRNNFFLGDEKLIETWFQNDLKDHPTYKNRLRKLGDQNIRTMDFDDQYAYIPDITIAAAKAITKERSTGNLMDEERWMSALSGFTSRIGFADVSDASMGKVDSIATVMAVHLQMDSVLSKRVHIKGHPHIDSLYDKAAGQGGEFTTQEHANVMKNFMSEFLVNVAGYSHKDIHEIFYDKLSLDLDQKAHEKRILKIEKVVDGFPKIAKKHSEEFKYFLQKWQKTGCIASKFLPKNEITQKSTVSSYTQLDESLKFNKAAFQEWKNSKNANTEGEVVETSS